jgi:hypothetical protein
LPSFGRGLVTAPEPTCGACITAEEELENLQVRRARLEDLERDKETLLEEYAGLVPEELDELTSEERHQVYRMLRLQVFVFPNGDLEVRGVLREAVCTSTDTRLRILQNTNGLELRFRARLCEERTPRLEVMRV